MTPDEISQTFPHTVVSQTPEAMPPPENTPPSPPPVHKSKKGIAIVVMIPILLAVATIAVFAFMKINTPKMREDENFPTPMPTQEAVEDEMSDWKTYSGSSFTFGYPPTFTYLTYENGVVPFFDSQEKLEACKNSQEDQELREACYKSSFTFNGFYYLSLNEYEEELSERGEPEVFVPEVFTDSQGRTWRTYESLGEVYNFDAFTEQDGMYFSVHFQTKSSEKTFLNQILSTFEFTN